MLLPFQKPKMLIQGFLGRWLNQWMGITQIEVTEMEVADIVDEC